MDEYLHDIFVPLQAVRWHARLRTVQARKRPSHDGVDSSTPGLRPPPLLYPFFHHHITCIPFLLIPSSFSFSLSANGSECDGQLRPPRHRTHPPYARPGRPRHRCQLLLFISPVIDKVWLSKFFDMSNNITADLAFFLMSKLVKTIPQVSRSFMSANCSRLRLRSVAPAGGSDNLLRGGAPRAGGRIGEVLRGLQRGLAVGVGMQPRGGRADVARVGGHDGPVPAGGVASFGRSGDVTWRRSDGIDATCKREG